MRSTIPPPHHSTLKDVRKEQIEVMVADDHLLVRQALQSLLDRKGFKVVGTAADGQEAVQMAEELQPDIAVVDLMMPVMNGINAARQISRVSPDTKTILLTMYNEGRYAVEALRAGIKGFVLKTQAAEDLTRAIQEVMEGGTYLSPTVSPAVVDAYLGRTEYPSDPLTPREREVLQLIAEGKTTRKTAEILGISMKTVETHRSRIMEKLDIHDTANLVRYAIRRGLVRP